MDVMSKYLKIEIPVQEDVDYQHIVTVPIIAVIETDYATEYICLIPEKSLHLSDGWLASNQVSISRFNTGEMSLAGEFKETDNKVYSSELKVSGITICDSIC